MADPPPKVVVTSPPYNLGKKYSSYNDRRPQGEYLAWVRRWGALVHKIMDDDGSFFLNVGYTARAPDLPFRVLGQLREFFAVQNVIHWVKSISMPERGFAAGHFQPISSERYVNLCHEYVFHLTKTGSVKLDKLAIGTPYADKSNTTRWGHGRTVRDRGNVWFVPYEQKNGDMKHPAEFPPALPEMCVRLHGVSEGMLVYDPFAGIGSTAVACKRLGIDSIGTEIDPRYAALANERVASA